jgi:serine/threonine protein kinase
VITDRDRQLEEILTNALLQPQSARRDFVRKACAGDPTLFDEAEELLRSVAPLVELADSLALSRHAHAVAKAMTVEADLSENLLAVGSKAGPYRILRKQGWGGMGEVYLAEDTRLRRKVAIKVLFCRGGTAHDNVALLREARVASALNHPNICTVHEIAEHEGRALLVMEWLDGQTLDERIGNRPLPNRECLTLAGEIFDGLAAAHAAGVIHSDIKPSNIFVTSHGHAKILDFGVAKRVQALMDSSTSAMEPAPPISGRTDVSTDPPVRGGTPAYMSPEHIRGEQLDARSDVFCAGLVLYEMATGRAAFGGATAWMVAHSILTESPTAPEQHNPEITPALVAVINRAIEKDRAVRYRSAAELRADLERLRSDTAPIAVGKSPKRSSTIEKSTMNVMAAGEPLQLHRLTFGRGTVYSARFAPDGQTIVYSAAWSGGPIRLYMTRPENPESRPFGPADLQNADLLSISRNGQLAISLNRHTVGFVRTGVLAQLPFAGGAPRQLQQDIQEADWVDENTLVVVRRTATTSRVELPLGRVVYEAPIISGVRVAPDGNSVAFVQQHSFFESAGDVGVIQDGKAKLLSTGWGSVGGVAWSPEGTEIWFTASEPGSARALRSVNRKGHVRTLARFPHRLTLLDVWRDGRILLTADESFSVVVAETAPDNRQIDLTLFDRSSARDLSADGRTVLFDESGEAGGEKYSVYVRTLIAGSPVRVGDGLGLSLSPDGQWAMTASRSRTPPLLLVPVGPGESIALKAGGITRYLTATWLAGQRGFVVCGAEGERPFRLYVQSKTGKPKPISAQGVIGPAATSPDGRHVVGIDEDRRVWLYAVDGGARKPVPGIVAAEIPVQWSADGHALYLRPRGGALPLPIVRYDLRTGKRRQVRRLTIADPAGVLKIDHALLTRDARTFVFTYVRTLSDLYLVTGVR